MPTDYSKTGPEMVVDLVNEVNGTEFGIDDLLLGSPVVVDPPNPRNTSLIVTSTGTTTMVGSRTLTYDRIPLDQFFGDEDLIFDDNVQDYASVYDVLPAINAQYSINLNASHLYDDPIVRNGAEPYIVTLRARPGSLVFTGSVDIGLQEPQDNFIVGYDQTIVGEQYTDEYGNLLINPDDGINGSFALGQNSNYRLAIRPYILNDGPAVDDPTFSGMGDGAYEIGPELVNDGGGAWALDVIFESIAGTDFTQLVGARIIVGLDDAQGNVNTVTLHLVKNGENYELIDSDTWLASQAHDYASVDGALLMFRLVAGIFLPYMPGSPSNQDNALFGPMTAQVLTTSLEDGQVLESVSISFNVLGGESWPTWEPNTSVGQTHAPGGFMQLGADSGDANDGWFLKSRSAPISPGGEMVTALRLYGTNVPAGPSTTIGSYQEQYEANDRQNTEVDHIFEAVIGTDPIADGQTLMDRANIRIQFSVVDATYPGTQTFASVLGAVVGEPGSLELGFVPHPGFPPIQAWMPEFPANWTAPDMSSLQLRFSLKYAIENIPSNMWDGQGDVRVMVSILVTDKNDSNITLGEAVAILNSILLPDSGGSSGGNG